MKYQITVMFDTAAEAAEFLQQRDNPFIPAKGVVTEAKRVAENEAEKPFETTNHPAQGRVAEAAPAAAQSAPAEGAVTAADVNEAFRAYVNRGGGRTAKTAMENIMRPEGVTATSQATPEQLVRLKAKFDAS